MVIMGFLSALLHVVDRGRADVGLAMGKLHGGGRFV